MGSRGGVVRSGGVAVRREHKKTVGKLVRKRGKKIM